MYKLAGSILKFQSAFNIDSPRSRAGSAILYTGKKFYFFYVKFQKMSYCLSPNPATSSRPPRIENTSRSKVTYKLQRRSGNLLEAWSKASNSAFCLLSGHHNGPGLFLKQTHRSFEFEEFESSNRDFVLEIGHRALRQVNKGGGGAISKPEMMTNLGGFGIQTPELL